MSKFDSLINYINADPVDPELGNTGNFAEKESAVPPTSASAPAPAPATVKTKSNKWTWIFVAICVTLVAVVFYFYYKRK